MCIYHAFSIVWILSLRCHVAIVKSSPVGVRKWNLESCVQRSPERRGQNGQRHNMARATWLFIMSKHGPPFPLYGMNNYQIWSWSARMLQRQGKMSASAGQAWSSSVEMTGRATAVRSRYQGRHMFHVILLHLQHAKLHYRMCVHYLLLVIGCLLVVCCAVLQCWGDLVRCLRVLEMSDWKAFESTQSWNIFELL